MLANYWAAVSTVVKTVLVALMAENWGIFVEDAISKEKYFLKYILVQQSFTLDKVYI